MALTGVLAYAMSYSETARQHARPVAVALGLLLASICIVSVLYYLPVHPEEDHHLPGTLCLVMLAIVAIFPLRPTHTLVLAGATTMLHFALATVGPTLLGITAKPGAGHAMTTGLGALVALGVSSLMYAQRRRAFRANQVMQQALSSLQESQSRLLVSRVAASQGRLAAALAHELNTPLGVVNSLLDDSALKELPKVPPSKRIPTKRSRRFDLCRPANCGVITKLATYQGRKTGFERPTCENSSKRTAASEGSTYTHKPLTPTNRALVREANENGFTVNLSANNFG